MNAAYCGRLVLMHEREIGVDMENCFKQQQPCFRLVLLVVSLLSEVIGLYRPASLQQETQWDVPFPSLEELVTQSEAWQICTSQLTKRVGHIKV